MPKKKQSAKEYEKVMPFRLPSKDDFDEIARTLGLSESGKGSLFDLLQEINADIEMQNLYAKNHLTRDQSLEKLEDVEKAAKALRSVLIENEKMLPDFIPHRALEEVIRLFTFATITKAIGRDLRSEALIEATEQVLIKKSDKFTRQEIADEYLQIKSNAGLAYAGKLLVHALDTLIQPIEAWHDERRRQNNGGRTTDRSRRNFILVLALNAEKIIGEKPRSDVKSRFFDLCEVVFEICGVPCENLKNLIDEVLGDEGPLSYTFYL
jgi:hypothetical protein